MLRCSTTILSLPRTTDAHSIEPHYSKERHHPCTVHPPTRLPHRTPSSDRYTRTYTYPAQSRCCENQYHVSQGKRQTQLLTPRKTATKNATGSCRRLHPSLRRKQQQ
ncbi:unnamed protein product [Ectocarpus sp. 12 AP-2014]